MEPSEVLETLFDGKKVRILKIFFQSPEEEFYLREVSQKADVSAATTYRVINLLLDLDIIEMKRDKKTKYYQLADNKATEALESLFEEEAPDPLEELVPSLSAFEGVEKIVLHGEATEEKINLLIMGERVDNARVAEECGRVEEEFGVNVVEVTLTQQQFEQMSEMGSFPREKKQLWP